MSASLVGSEMCIRDRTVTEVSDQSELGPHESGPRGGGPSKPNGPNGPPVSYTHLTLPTICSV
eukprot:9476802-Alexandrium_andersonii.AAC.1